MKTLRPLRASRGKLPFCESLDVWKCLLCGQKVLEEREYVKHIRFKKPLCVMMDGKRRISIILNGGGAGCKGAAGKK